MALKNPGITSHPLITDDPAVALKNDNEDKNDNDDKDGGLFAWKLAFPVVIILSAMVVLVCMPSLQ